MKNSDIKYTGSKDKILISKAKHLVVFWEKDVHVIDSLNVNEIETCHFNKIIAKVRFSYDSNLLLVYAVNGQIYEK